MEIVAVSFKSLIKSMYPCHSLVPHNRLGNVSWQCYYRKYNTSQHYIRQYYPVLRNGGVLCPQVKSQRQTFVHFSVNNAGNRYLHTSSPKCALPPALLLFLRPLSKFAAILFGRSLRMWWKKLPADKRLFMLEAFRSHRYLLLGLGASIGGGICYFYITHLEVDPLTKRERFIAFSDDQMKAMAKIEQEAMLSKFHGCVLPASHPVYKEVAKVAMHILESNMDIDKVKHTNWSLIVINSIDDKNAFVLPNGTIFIFTGMLTVCNSIDQLGIIISHEVAHVLLSHMAEQMSRLHLHELLMIVPIIILWALFPDGVAMFSQWLSNLFVNTLVHLPFSRSVESEADEVGLQLAAKACLDVREASAFWEKMKSLSDSESEEVIEFLSTHPAYDTRKKFLDSKVPEAMKLREKCNCPALSPLDPRTIIKTEISRKIL
ncbi:metalloendopeptidase OMA1, mitochondrial-like [Schistocerca gregaria]|uniref:metalloendopeptidase OMA1, mitochondrial-like n=1 Tax=Schistocerca gregaria TaxID=7010 RepID=UPI00211E496A|nr:metalloendopeptidase OMA1, mitochondrial-like [Schistocerca gregaria]